MEWLLLAAGLVIGFIAANQLMLWTYRRDANSVLDWLERHGGRR